MNTVKVRMVRVYVTQTKKNTDKIIQHLEKEIKIRGITLFRAIEGYGDSGEHSASLIDLSMNLPLVIEFFDDEAKVALALDYLATIIKPEHIVTWDAFANA